MYDRDVGKGLDPSVKLDYACRNAQERSLHYAHNKSDTIYLREVHR